MIDTRNDDIAGKYFDLVQQEIKNLISQDKEIKPDEVEKFNAEIFNQPDDIKSEIRRYIDKATVNNLDIKKVAKIIYDKFKVQVKNNVFNQDDVNDVPNRLMGERKFIKTFEQFKKFESSYFHTIDDINKILDKISDSGYESLDDSERAILINFSKDDEDIHNILLKMNGLVRQFAKIMKKSHLLDPKEFKKEWISINTMMNNYEMTLKHLYKSDVEDIKRYVQDNNLLIKNDDY